MKTVRLSILMPTYNHGPFLKNRISSILSQLQAEDELIIIDDDSQDASDAIIQKFVQIDHRIKHKKNDINLGPIRSVNLAIEMARGEYLSWLASDDRILPGFIEETVNALSSQKNLGLCCSDYAEWYDGFPDKSPEEITIKPLLEKTSTGVRFFNPSEMVQLFQRTNFWIPGHTTIVRRDLIDKYGGFDERLGRFCDWFLLHKIALHHGLAYISKVLAIFRRNPESYSSKNSKLQLRQTSMNVLKVLNLPSNLSTRTLYKKSGLLRYQICHHLFYFIATPVAWDILAWWLRRYLILRWHRFRYTERDSKIGIR